jgi:hypothetical protein
MTIDRVYFAFMTLAGAAVGAALAIAPWLQDVVIKPYFWVLIAVGLFDAGALLLRRNAPWAMLSMKSRLIGFAIGIALMAAIPTLAGVQVNFF